MLRPAAIRRARRRPAHPLGDATVRAWGTQHPGTAREIDHHPVGPPAGSDPLGGTMREFSRLNGHASWCGVKPVDQRKALTRLVYIKIAEYRDQGIRCNAVCPGFVKTAHGLREIDELDTAGQEWEEGALVDAQGRICEPEEVTSAVVFLASDEASFITGNALYVDNGWYAKG